jgi:LCP family protein required for cell wall assembly
MMSRFVHPEKLLSFLRRKGVILGITLGIFALILLIGGYQAVQLYRQPQAPTLSLVMPVTAIPTKTGTPLPTNTPLASPTLSSTKVSPTRTQPPTKTIPPTEVPKVCGQMGAWTVMILGRSARTVPAGVQSIRLLNADFDKKAVRIYSFPASLVVDTPGLEETYGIKFSYLEDIYPQILKQLGEDKVSNYKATQAIAQVILDTFGVPLDHYITIKVDVVMESVDAIGGIDVVLPEDFKMPADSSYKGKVLKAGEQHFDGEMLHAYVSVVRPGEDEFDRLRRQNVVMEGLQKKLYDPTTYLKIIELYSLYKENIVTDLSFEQMTSLGCLARQIPRDQIVMGSPGEDELIYWVDGTMHLKNAETTSGLLQEFFGIR